jgi:hypothetical protein
MRSQWVFDSFRWHRLVSGIVPDSFSRDASPKNGSNAREYCDNLGLHTNVRVHHHPGYDMAV